MGTDIHMVAQIQPKGRDYWTTVGAVFPDPWYRVRWPADPGDRWFSSPLTARPYRDRNYTVFAVLADVRNGTGFAGVDTGDRVPVIAEPRGFPEDLTEDNEYLLSDHFLVPGAEPVWTGDHSHSWLSLRELVSYDWDHVMVKRGYVSEVPADGDTPEGWSGMVSGQMVETQFFGRDWEAARSWLADVPEGKKRYAGLEWSVPIRDHCQSFLTAVSHLEELGRSSTYPEGERWTYGDDAYLDRVRICFGFDS